MKLRNGLVALAAVATLAGCQGSHKTKDTNPNPCYKSSAAAKPEHFAGGDRVAKFLGYIGPVPCE